MIRKLCNLLRRHPDQQLAVVLSSGEGVGRPFGRRPYISRIKRLLQCLSFSGHGFDLAPKNSSPDCISLGYLIKFIVQTLKLLNSRQKFALNFFLLA